MHVHYDSDGEAERVDSHGQAGPKPHFPRACCVSSIPAAASAPGQCYVLHTAWMPESNTLAAALSTRATELYAVSPAGLRPCGSLERHPRSVTALLAGPPGSAAPLHTACADGIVRAWDPRQPGPVCSLASASRAEALSVAAGPALVAAGVGDTVAIWDTRTRHQLAHWGDTHAQDVTAVALHPTLPNALLSGSEDGLLAVFDLSSGLDEDESFRAALNIEDAVAAMGWYGAGGAKLWVTTGTESLHLWEWQAACMEETGGGQGALASMRELRQELSRLTPEFEDGVQYLVGCQYDAGADALAVLGGSIEGGLALYPMDDRRPGGAAGPPRAALAGGHNDIVRCATALGGGILTTGGEDGRICLWDLNQEVGPSGAREGAPASAAAIAGMPPPPVSQPRAGAKAGSSKHHGPAHTRRASPY